MKTYKWFHKCKARADAKREYLDTEKLEKKESPNSLSRKAFLKLPIDERRRILEEQAEQMQKHYESDDSWRLIQDGDIL
jgi:hypothetical protein